MFLYAVIVPVIPFALHSRSHVAASRVQYWVSVLVAVYGATLLAFSPVCGWLADQTSSRRSPLLIGLLALVGATIALNVGSSCGVLIVGRVLQGASAAVVWVVGFALLADTVPQEKMGQAMGYVSLGMSVGLLIAPLLGGVVFEHGGYNAVFGMAYALVGVDILLRLTLVEKKVAVRWVGDCDENVDMDIPSNVVEMSRPSVNSDPEGNAAPSSFPQSPDRGKAIPEPTNPEMATSSSRSPLRTRLPPLLSLLYSRRLLSALFGSLVQASLMTAFDSVLVIHAASIFHWQSTASSLLFLPLVLPSFAAPLVGYLMDRIGPKYPASLGFALACPPFVCLRFVDKNSIGDKVLLCALLCLIGISLMLTFPPIMAEIAGVVEQKEQKMIQNGRKGWGKGGAYAQAYGLFNMAFAGGCLVGPLLAGFIRESVGWGTMAWVLGLLSAVTALPTFLWMGGWRKEETGG